MNTIEIAKENESLKKQLETALESAKNADSNLAFAIGANEDLKKAHEIIDSLQMTNQHLEERVKELEETINHLEWEKKTTEGIEKIKKSGGVLGNHDNEPEREEYLYSKDDLVKVSSNFQFVLQYASDDHMATQLEKIKNLYELVSKHFAARLEEKETSEKLYKFLDSGLNEAML